MHRKSSVRKQARPAAHGARLKRRARLIQEEKQQGVSPALVGLAVAGGALAASALYVQSRTRRAEAEHPPVGRFLDIDGVRLHYVERGSGEPLVLLHGNGALVQDFALSGLIDLASRSYRVIVFDRPGYGYSSRPRSRLWTPEAQAALFADAFRALGVRAPVVLGHSWGALVALALGVDYRFSVKSLVLASGYYYPTLRADVPFLAAPALPVLGDLLRYSISPLLARMLWRRIVRELFAPNPIPGSFERFPIWMALRPSQIRAAAEESALMIPAARRLSERLGEIEAPTVILAGAGDRIVSTARQSETLHRDIPGSRLRILPGVGHMLHHVAPGAVLAAVDEAAAMRGRRGAGRDQTTAADTERVSQEGSVSSATHAAQ